jgi:hypothetical protein
MGLDGGTLNDDRKIIVSVAKKSVKPTREYTTFLGWSTCAISGDPLAKPIVIDSTGKLINKESLITALLSKSLDKSRFPNIKSLKDVYSANLEPNPNKGDEKPLFICPITKKEMCGIHKFLFLKFCGHAVHQDVFKELKDDKCPVCGKLTPKNERILLNPPQESESEKRKREDDVIPTSKKISTNSVSTLVESIVKKAETNEKSDSKVYSSIFRDKSKKEKNDFLNRSGMSGPSDL